MAGTSAWRVSDVVEYNLVREVGVALSCALLEALRRDLSPANAVRVELMSLHREVATVDGFDRAAVADLMSRLETRLAELTAVGGA